VGRPAPDRLIIIHRCHGRRLDNARTACLDTKLSGRLDRIVELLEQR
jgi:hypothetical protein